ncbi:MAG: hypothetical protein QXF56_03095 [Candidatus Micrarchaeia archaeon]
MGKLELIVFLFLINEVAACLSEIDPALGVNPSFFNMSDETNIEIYNQNISAEEKFYLLIHNAFGNSPLLQKTREYNLLLPFSCPPNETNLKSGAFVKDAWVRVIAVIPSIIDNESWALPEGEVLTRYNYSVELPASASNSYPDCGAVYTLLDSAHNLSVYINDKNAGSEIANYKINSTELNVKAELSVFVNVKEDMYSSACYCCGEEECVMCCSCEFQGSRNIAEQIVVSDSVRKKVYQLNASADLRMLSCPDEPLRTAKGNLSVNFTPSVQSLFLSFQKANLTLRLRELDVLPVMKPHNVLEVVSIPIQHEFSERMLSSFAVSNNSVFINFSGVPRDEIGKPSLVITDLFGRKHEVNLNASCPLNPKIELLLPKFVEEGMEFRAIVRLTYNGTEVKQKRVAVNYSGKRFFGETNEEGEASFILKANQSLVEVTSEYDGVFSEVSARGNVAVYNSSEITYMLSLLAFLFILVISYIGFRRVSG